MNSIKHTLILTFAFFQSCLSLSANHHKAAVPMDDSHWTIKSEGFKFEEHLGAQSLYLPSGVATLNDVVFHNGIIEFDIAFPEGRGFPGIFFRSQDDRNSEEFYVRPHQSGNPDANQYTPRFNRTAAWQLYHGDGYGAALDFKYNAWNHVKLVISGTVGEVFVNDMETPLFQIYELKHGDVEGPILLKGNANSHFANFSYVQTDNPPLKLPIKEVPDFEAGVIAGYQISNVIEDTALEGETWFREKHFSELARHSAWPDYTGSINISKGVDRSEGKNTALVKINVSSRTKQIKKFDFGYSDEVLAFVNGQLVYSGTNEFRTRDYRYLGTIGYFDSIYLDLEVGDNDIVFAIKEVVGGWGMKAKIEDQSGLTFHQ
ncbi:MAG: hypothetical protein O3C20_23590 [Verrucomicrobia bacterium]|nr:hypothetical protein [Verrucomicrobiota bacterium]